MEPTCLLALNVVRVVLTLERASETPERLVPTQELDPTPSDLIALVRGGGGIDVLLMLLDGENTLRTTILDFRTTINRQQLSFPL